VFRRWRWFSRVQLRLARSQVQAGRTVVACGLAREAISALLDGERSPIDGATVRAHLDSCSACRDFESQVPFLTRRGLLRRFEPAPDLAAEILESLGTGVHRADRRNDPRRREHRRRAMQWAVATLPICAAVPALALGTFTHPHIVPSRAPTPCTVSLHHRDRSQ